MDATELAPLKLETADLDAQIDALIRQATQRLREQRDQVRRSSETANHPTHWSEGIGLIARRLLSPLLACGPDLTPLKRHWGLGLNQQFERSEVAPQDQNGSVPPA